jgi:hypothetical protein
VIKFENTEVFNFEGAFRGMRNPMNSWDRSDSETVIPAIIEDDDSYTLVKEVFVIGKNDLELAQKLIKGGSVHAKFMRQIFVSVDITAPLYWWKEFDTYKVGTVANSCSTMHKIHSEKFTRDNFSCEHLLNKSNSGFVNCVGVNIEGDTEYFTALGILDFTIEALNFYRDKYLATKDKAYWWQMIQLLPSSYNQKRTVTMSYENIRSMYIWRRGHKLDEWSTGFMEWIDSLPYADELIKYV